MVDQTTAENQALTAQSVIAANEAAAAAAYLAKANPAPLNSPVFTGTPEAPTAPQNTNNAQVATTAYLDRLLGAATGVATLDSGGHIPTAQLPPAVLGGLAYQGVWNASTNTPTIVSGTGTNGYFYIVDVAGSTNIDGHSTWNVGDWIVYQDASVNAWERVAPVYTPVVGITLSSLATQAPDTFVANGTGSTASPTAITPTAAMVLLPAMVGDSGSGGTKGAVPAPTSGSYGAGKYLDAGGNWSVPPGTGVSMGTLASYALLNSPALTGTPTAPTQAVDTSSTGLATCAFVLAQAASANPIIDGTAAPGVSTRYARADHVHPTDSSRAPATGSIVYAPLASPVFTGTPEAPTAALADNSTKLATTAYADRAGGGLPSGTIMLFQQTAAPTGWTKITTYNDVGIRVVSGAVGAVTGATAFSTVFSQTVTGSHILSINEMPGHTHSYSGTDFINSYMDTAPNNPTVGDYNGSLTSGSTGGGLGHTHTVALNLNYVDVIFASKV